MNRVHNTKARDLQKPIPGCMGRMINMFDLSTGMPRAKLLSEKAYRDGTPICRHQPDVAKAMDAIGVQIENKPIVSESRSSSKKSCGTPVKMLIAQEMPNEIESKQMPPNVVARLMGLDALPIHPSVLNARRSSHGDYSHDTSAGLLRGYKQKENWCYDNPMLHDIRPCANEKEYKDVYEVSKKSSETSLVKDQTSQKGRYNGRLIEKRMAFVRQKFIEAKRLSTDEELIPSKDFQDALEILSSNRDFFLKFFEEPKPPSSNNIHEVQTIPLLSQTRRITVLKPTKTVESKSGKHGQEQLYPSAEESGWERNKHHWSYSLTHQKAESIPQPTRIVVLKPSPGKPHEIKTISACSVRSPIGRDVYGGMGPKDAMGSREVAKEITQQMRNILNSNCREESLLSSVLSNRYVRDDSSLNRLENHYIDSEIVSPTSRHSWDCINRLDSPLSISSLCRASYSPESSVVKEAKKRLSERWKLVASNGISQEQRQERGASTLAEMLGIPEVKNKGGSGESTVLNRRSCRGEPDLLSIGGRKDEYIGESSPKNLLRSNSVPISSLSCENVELNKEVPHLIIRKPVVPKEVVKSKRAKSSFKEKVSSLFFSRIKKPGGEKSVRPPLVSSDAQSGIMEATVRREDDLSRSGHASCSEEITRFNCEEEFGNSNSVNNGPKQSTSSTKASPPLEKPRRTGKSREIEDQPIAISVLEALFEDDANDNVSHSFIGSCIVGHPQALSRSPPIESVARSLSRGSETLRHCKGKRKEATSGDKELELERFAFIQKLLSSSGLDDVDNSSAVFGRWHSPDSPLDPMLMDELLANEEGEAEFRVRWSNQKLLFDLVNAALVGIAHTTLMGSYPWAGTTCGGTRKGGPISVEVVWGMVREWSSGEARNSSLMEVDRMVKVEVAGRGGGAETMLWWSEMEEIGKEIGGRLIDELVEEALTDF